MSPQQVAVIIVAAALGALILLLLAYGRPRRSEQEPLPTNFSRGDPDAVLEGSRLQRIQIWGVASSIFIAGFLSLYFVAEPFRQQAFRQSDFAAADVMSVQRGEHSYSPAGDANCASCHGPTGEGGFAATDITWPAPPLNNVMHRYPRTEVRRIIEMGRPGTPMPPWSIVFGGPLNDQMIEDILHFLDEIQVPFDDRYELAEDVMDGGVIFARKCAVCHGDEGRGRGMGSPIPTFYAPDLTTVFYRMGVTILRQQDPDFDPQQAGMQEILDAGEEAVLTTIRGGRPNTPMPPFADRILPEQLDAVMEYLRGIQRPAT